MPTLMTVTIDPAQKRNAREELRTRVEGNLTRNLDDPVVIREVDASTLEVQIPDAVPAEEVSAVIRTIANLVRRPESGILSNVLVSPENTEGLQRHYSV